MRLRTHIVPVVIRLWCFVCVLCLLPTPALADRADPDAEQHFLEGVRLYRLQKYDLAIAEYEKALALGGDQGTVYDLAQAHRLAGHAAQALMYFRIFAQLSPQSPLRFSTKNQVTQLTLKLKHEWSTAAPPEPAAASATPSASAETTPPGLPETPVAATGGAGNADPALHVATGSSPAVVDDSPRLISVAAVTPPPLEEPAPPTKRGPEAVVAGTMLVVLGAGVLGGGVGAAIWAHVDATQVTQGVRFNPALESEGHNYALIGVGLSIGGAAVILIGAEILRRHYAAHPPSTLRASSSLRPTAMGFEF